MVVASAVHTSFRERFWSYAQPRKLLRLEDEPLPSRQRACDTVAAYELIVDNSPCHPYMDIEFFTEERDEEHNVLKKVCAGARAMIMDVFGFQPTQGTLCRSNPNPLADLGMSEGPSSRFPGC